MWVDPNSKVKSLLPLASPLLVEQPYDLLSMVESAPSSLAKSTTHPMHPTNSTSFDKQKTDSMIPRTRSKSSSQRSTNDSRANNIHIENNENATSNSAFGKNPTEKEQNKHSRNGIDMFTNNNPDDNRSHIVEKNYVNIPPLAEEFIREDPYSDLELNSSPIKTSSKVLPQKASYGGQLSSSPIKRKKCVAFSDDLVSELPSSPTSSPYNAKVPAIESTPKKSILKLNYNSNASSPCNPNDSTFWVKSSNSIHTKNSPSNPQFWISGTIIQLPANSPDLLQLVDGCISVLKDESFTKKFEVYATLNNICKFNTSDCLLKIFTIQNKSIARSNQNLPKINSKTQMNSNSSSSMDSTYIHMLSTFIQRDVTLIESKLFFENEEKENQFIASKNDPFGIRIISQALKLMNFIMLDLELNNFISIEDAKWFYVHSCKMIVKPTISKTLMIPYLSILKDCKFANKKKRLIFNNQNENINILELILQSLLNMRKFVSSSLVVEEFVTLKNLVLNFPAMMANNFKHWFEFFLMNLCDLSSPLYSKIINMGILVLLEVARNYLDNKNVLFSVRQFLSSPLPSEVKSIMSETKISTSLSSSNSSNSDEQLVIDFIISSLETLIENDQFKSAMDIWVGLTLLSGDCALGYENWPYLSKWLKVHKLCFNKPNKAAKVIALNSWKAIIFNVCHDDLENIKHLIDSALSNNNNMSKPQAINNILRPKVKLLIHPLLNISSVENENDIIDSSHHLFLSIIYNLLNPISWNTSKYVQIYWDKIILPVLVNFYFKKDLSNTYMNELGVKILIRLMKNSNNINEKPFNEMRCLSNEPVSLNDINPISPKWIFNRFDRIMQNITIVFKLENLSIDSKLELFYCFLNCLKLTTKKEIRPSEATYDIIDNMPGVLNILLEHNSLDFASINKLIVNLHDSFDSSNLIGKSNVGFDSNSSNIYTTILKHCLRDLEVNQRNELLGSIYTAIGEKKNLAFLLEIIKLQTNKDLGMNNFIRSTLNAKRVSSSSKFDLESIGELFQLITSDFEIVAKKLIQGIVLQSATEFERSANILKIHLWTLPIFKYFVELVHDAPHPHLRKIQLDLIITKWKSNDNDVFFDILKFLIDKRFDAEIYNLRINIMEIFQVLEGFRQFEFRQVWNAYISCIIELTQIQKLDELLVSSYDAGLDIKSHIQNRWNDLPLLRQAWLKDNKELYIDDKFPHYSDLNEVANEFNNSDIQKSETQMIDNDSNVNGLDSIESISNISIPNLGLADKQAFDDSNVNNENSKSGKKKQKTVTRSKVKKKTNNGIKKENILSPEVNPNFDIHSFTAMLNAKLSPDTLAETPIRKSRRTTKSSKRKQSKSRSSELSDDPSDNSISQAVSSEIQIPSSFDNDDISQVEPSKDSQTTTDKLDIVEDISESSSTNELNKKLPSPHSNDYSKIIQSGFAGQDTSNTSDEIENTCELEVNNNKRKNPSETNERKKIKLDEDIMEDSSREDGYLCVSSTQVAIKDLDPTNMSPGNAKDIEKSDSDNSVAQNSSTSTNDQASFTFDTGKFKATSTAIAKSDESLFHTDESLSKYINNLESALPPVRVGTSEDNIKDLGSKADDFLSTIGEADELLDTHMKEESIHLDTGNISTGQHSTVDQTNIGNRFSTLIKNTSDNDISNMTRLEKYKLETKLLKFVLHMRSIDCTSDSNDS